MSKDRRCCRYCKWLNAGADKNGKRFVRETLMYKCSIPLPEVCLPICFKDANPTEHQRKYVSPSSGWNCYFFVDVKDR